MDSRPRVLTVLGTRPEIIKCSTLLPRFDELYEHVLVHTGQHYDEQMDAVFFRELGLRAPDFSLDIGSDSHAGQLARMLVGIEVVLMGRQPDLVFVQGDTNSSLAGGLTAAKLNIPVAHLEAGCRSFNRNMPEETNRVVIDHLSDILLAPDEIAAANLRREGIPAERIAIVGSTAVDACLRVTGLPASGQEPSESGADGRDYLVATIHRAENTTPERLPGLIAALGDLATTWPVIIPIHPRTARAIEGIPIPAGIRLIDPVGYATMMRLLRHCRALLTDSGGLQEEAAVLGTPTFILRDETEWRAFVDAGRHQLVGTDTTTIVDAVRTTLTGGEREKQMRQPIGLERAGSTERVIAVLERVLNEGGTGRNMWTLEGRTAWNQHMPISSNGHAAPGSYGVAETKELETDR